MPLDPAARAYLDRIESLGLQPVEQQTVSEARTSAESMADALFGVKEAVADVDDTTISDAGAAIPVRAYRPAAADDRSAVLYFHGGGWVFGSFNTHDGVCRALAAGSGSMVVSVNYRLAPEHRFPAAVEDAWTATQWLTQHGSDLGLRSRPRVAVAGDSAGANLAAVVALRARDTGLDLRYQVLICPVTDCRATTASYGKFATGFGLTRAEMQWFLGHYIPSEADRDDPRASPLRAKNHAGVAPAYIVTAEFDPLRDEGEAYAAKLEADGVPTRLTRYDGVIHGFYRMGSVFTQTRQALAECARALRTSLIATGVAGQ